jgi:hypothetical protein
MEEKMSLFLAFHDSTTMVACSDRRVVTRNAAGQQVPAGNDSPKFICLPNNLVLAGLGRLDIAARMLDGTERMLETHPEIDFDGLVGFFHGALSRTFERRANPKDYDGLATALCGWDAHLKRIRCVSWHSSERFEPWERYDPVQNLLAMGVVGVDTRSACDDLARRMLNAPKKPAIIAENLSTAVVSISKKNPKLVSRDAYFAGFERDRAVLLPPEFEPPIATLQGESRFMVGSILTPMAGGLDTTGNNDGGAGAQVGMKDILYMSLFASALDQGTVSHTNLQNAVDGDVTSYASITMNGNGSLNNSRCLFTGPAGITRAYASRTLKMLVGVPTNSLNDVTSVAALFTWAYDNYASGWPSGAKTATLLSVLGGVTQSQILLSAAIPAGVNLSQVACDAYISTAGTGGTATSGSIEARIYGAWIECTE